MHAAGARVLPDQHQQAAPGSGLSLVEPEDREAVLMQWERKIEQAERGGRFARDEQPAPRAATAEPAPERRSRFDRFEEALQQDPEPPAESRAERSAPVVSVTPAAPAAQRRTITITGQPTPARRRPSLAERHIAAQPDRIALWAFLLGLLLIAVAAGTAHA